ncbi:MULTISPECIES: ABC transporter permease [unclassified Paenibacillus]|uniref:ABC transporter permease n=1 Tax=unclassified Paenibacillus TaxID=185978 RepID=UPI00095699A0|nr:MULTISPECIES: ABC transporter permease [unclassified Paenibacillus]ASS66803.1 ABC transporter permease [Paenibacillus sp. RUD330]SIP94950.1 osmoprotectant transport system permease protein [Paenibacillus sp. RU4X]SIQ13451.1 osmoprotectant transport system permease protein [Paenibacillus sp. RU4T]
MPEQRETLADFWNYLYRNRGLLSEYFIQHVQLVAAGVLLALAAGVPLGILCTRSRPLARIILAITGILQVVPSLAMLVLLMLWMGLGNTTVMAGLFLYSLNPIVRNTYVGLQQVGSSFLEAGRGVGMSRWQLLWSVRMPLSLPYMMTGIRIAAVIAIGVATIAPLVGGDGLGREVYAGINGQNSLRIYAGALPAALLAIVADIVLGYVQKRFDPADRASRRRGGGKAEQAVPPVPKAQG